MFQEMIQQQYALDREAKMERLDCETLARVELINTQKKSKDLKVLAINTNRMDMIRGHRQQSISIFSEMRLLENIFRIQLGGASDCETMGEKSESGDSVK
uniref:Uncharacterized protein n=1 Tax=Tanacetum cinerariifolium TaxID=118510 RepID=A0A699HNS8_TANCI|nr:hypothetical protein [Tanacetum cinerariifolium]